jgi:hypothetical protein
MPVTVQKIITLTSAAGTMSRQTTISLTPDDDGHYEIGDDDGVVWVTRDDMMKLRDELNREFTQQTQQTQNPSTSTFLTRCQIDERDSLSLKYNADNGRCPVTVALENGGGKHTVYLDWSDVDRMVEFLQNLER